MSYTAIAPAPEEPKLTPKALTADHPTWCPGCGDFAVLAAYYRALEQLNYPHESIVTMAGIGCSSRFLYFVNSHGGHFIHERSVPFSAGVSLSRDDLKVFVFGGDGDGFSIGGHNLDHVARKNVNLTYVIMDNQVYGLTQSRLRRLPRKASHPRPTRGALSISPSIRCANWSTAAPPSSPAATPLRSNT
ncbi:MAG: hypothetical protein J6386_07135 [Candidatus Synoicihabitans palmerolidicus]|nr:hypothetical protein [Candidatus Synoicihabitans palmerolidicus]